MLLNFNFIINILSVESNNLTYRWIRKPNFFPQELLSKPEVFDCFPFRCLNYFQAPHALVLSGLLIPEPLSKLGSSDCFIFLCKIVIIINLWLFAAAFLSGTLVFLLRSEWNSLLSAAGLDFWNYSRWKSSMDSDLFCYEFEGVAPCFWTINVKPFIYLFLLHT
jgi:hypothetical protein